MNANIDFRPIADRAGSLFPFVTQPAFLERLNDGARGDGRRGLANPFAPERRPHDSKPALLLDDAALQALIDKAWARRDRWQAFQSLAGLVRVYHPDEGRLPALLRGHVDQNVLQPYADTTMRDPRLWAELALAAAHSDFIRVISEYVSGHPGTRATTELLFMLDKLAQGSLDALVTLRDIVPNEDLRWTRDTNRDAYRAIVRIRQHYRALLAQRGLDSHEALGAYYDDARITILSNVLRTTPRGYRAGDARFLIGAIQWKRGRREEARRTWSGLTVDPQDTYVATYSRLLDAVQRREGRELDPLEIHRILDFERGRWLVSSLDRLRQFGHHVDTY